MNYYGKIHPAEGCFGSRTPLFDPQFQAVPTNMIETRNIFIESTYNYAATTEGLQEWHSILHPNSWVSSFHNLKKAVSSRAAHSPQKATIGWIVCGFLLLIQSAPSRVCYAISLLLLAVYSKACGII